MSQEDKDFLSKVMESMVINETEVGICAVWVWRGLVWVWGRGGGSEMGPRGQEEGMFLRVFLCTDFACTNILAFVCKHVRVHTAWYVANAPSTRNNQAPGRSSRAKRNLHKKCYTFVVDVRSHNSINFDCTLHCLLR